MMRRDAGERDRLRALVEGADWAQAGTSAVLSPSETQARDVAQTAKPPR
jgi:ATP-dependent protease HslVU (ClpYQ) peptidase subunit